MLIYYLVNRCDSIVIGGHTIVIDGHSIVIDGHSIVIQLSFDGHSVVIRSHLLISLISLKIANCFNNTQTIASFHLLPQPATSNQLRATSRQ